jgi:MYXO-CTERM domain-containing protein
MASTSASMGTAMLLLMLLLLLLGCSSRRRRDDDGDDGAPSRRLAPLPPVRRVPADVVA